jgi:flagellar hook assembly protein FlgD
VYPNPFNPSTTIEFSLPDKGIVNLEIYNLRGQKVRTLLDSEKRKGVQTIIWDGKDNFGCSVSSGIYFIRLEAIGKTSTHKVMLMK